MAEFVQQRIEEMVSELNTMQNIGLFDGAEIREIVRKRKSLEYKLRRKTKEKQDFLMYIKYEMCVLALIKKRRKQNKCMVKVKEIEVPVVKRIHKLFDLACTRFKDDIKLWLSHIEFCKQKHEKKSASRLYASLLKLHPHNADVWVSAAKHELECRQSVQNARGLLQQAINVNPEVQQLWLQYFHMELLSAESLRQKLDHFASANMQTDEPNALVLRGEAAKIVYKNACNQFPDNVDLRLSFIDILQMFNFTDTLRDFIYTDLKENFSTSEVACSAIAKRPLQKAFTLHSNYEASNDEIKELEQDTFRQFDEAVSSLPTELMWSLYLETCLDLIQRTRSLRHNDDIALHTLDIFEQAYQKQLLSEEMSLSWLKLLRRTGQIQEALHVSSCVIQRFTASVPLWLKRVKLIIQTNKTVEPVLNVISAALDACKLSKDVKVVDLWKLVVTWSVIHYPENVVTLCERGIAVPSSGVCLYMKHFYFDYSATHNDVQTVRCLYRRLMSFQPTNVSLVQSCVTFELSQVKPKMKYIRRCYEEALLQFGTKDIDIWLNYIKMELTSSRGKPENVAHLHWRAEKDLDPVLVNEFKQQFALITNDSSL